MKRVFAFIAIFLVLIIGVFFLYRFNYIPHKQYEDSDFGITRIASEADADGDGIEDYEDILLSARNYLDTKPKYKSKYYASTGYPNDEYGVCTDVIGFALGGAGYDLMQLVAEDIEAHGEDYDIDEPDSAIDFRRVKNLRIYFKHTAEELTTDINEIDKWQAGDIVLWKNHIGLISDKRNSKGIPFVLHNANPVQASYEEDILEIWGEIVGHYRIRGEAVVDDDPALENTKDDDISEENVDVSNPKGKETSESEISDDNESISLITSAADLNFRGVDPATGKYAFTYNGEEFTVIYKPDNWKIIDSYKINNEHDMTIICKVLIDEHPVHGSDMSSYRTADDMVYEWFQHNLLYEVLPADSNWKDHAKDVDFDPKDQNRSFEEIYEDRTGKELSLDDIFSRIANGN